MRKPYKLIATGVVALTIFVSAALTSTGWASAGAGFLIVMAFPILLLGATFPLAVGGMALFRGHRSTDLGKMDLVAAAVAFLIVGVVISYVIFYFMG